MCPLEIPFCHSCLDSDGFMAKFIKSSALRSLLYLIFAIVLWASLSVAISTLIIPAISMTITAILYMTSLFKKEEPVKSTMTGGSGVEGTAGVV